MHSGIDCQIPDSFLGDTPKLRAYDITEAMVNSNQKVKPSDFAAIKAMYHCDPSMMSEVLKKMVDKQLMTIEMQKQITEQGE